MHTHLHSPCAEHCAGQPSSVQCRPFQPRTHRQVPFLHCPWSAQRGSHSRLWHCSPDQPAGNRTCISSCTVRGARSAGHTPGSGTARPTSLQGTNRSPLLNAHNDKLSVADSDPDPSDPYGMFLGLLYPDPHPLVRGMDPDLAPDLDPSFIKQKL
jgi:hypothetical protein